MLRIVPSSDYQKYDREKRGVSRNSRQEVIYEAEVAAAVLLLAADCSSSSYICLSQEVLLRY
jgi:hypothetical protein